MASSVNGSVLTRVVCRFFMQFLPMFIAIVVTQAISIVIVLLVIKNFFRQLMVGITGNPSQSSPRVFSSKADPMMNLFKEEKNQIPEADPDEMEFSEDSPMALPKNLKFEIEGGDSLSPPEFPVEEKA